MIINFLLLSFPYYLNEVYESQLTYIKDDYIFWNSYFPDPVIIHEIYQVK